MGICIVAGGAWNLFQKKTAQQQPDAHQKSEIRAISQSPRMLARPDKTKARPLMLWVGLVVIEDIAGNRIAQIPASLSPSGWAAIPAKPSVGGYRWYFRFIDGSQQEINAGILGDDDPMGLWQIHTFVPGTGPPIAAGNMDQSFQWHSIISEKTINVMEPAILSEHQNCIHIAFPEAMSEPGVFIQNSRIVGWSFGEKISGGFIWTGKDETNLVVELSVSDVYRATFEGGREEQFILGRLHEQTDPLKALEYFANGFRAAPKLAESDTPPEFKKQNMISKMRALASELVQAGYAADVCTILDPAVLTQAGDASFAADAVRIRSHVRGMSSAADLIEKLILGPSTFHATDLDQIRGLLKDTYQQWLTNLVESREYATGFEVYTRAAAILDDPELHILGAKFAIAFNDWTTAENILGSHRFPIGLVDQVKSLEGQIAQLKQKSLGTSGEKDKIIIHFSPGAQRIPVTAVINHTINVNFIVDTGASMVTIPRTAAKSLGLDINAAPVRQLITASQIISAPEVTLDSIQIGQRVERHVKALILDMPDQDGQGLLGLNYLNRFQMDMNLKSGTLTLTPK